MLGGLADRFFENGKTLSFLMIRFLPYVYNRSFYQAETAHVYPLRYTLLTHERVPFDYLEERLDRGGILNATWKVFLSSDRVVTVGHLELYKKRRGELLWRYCDNFWNGR